ncbi:hypothetical protein M441DRAFT_368538 [Trichoderma asperellum CBS 433.97]|uniref:Uncharacterized protein n=1 Tax=Trichoderma asperellum (strain ATCC 204424 / CBS 433.97 / NBRC 101777) TaxID=1042311 RepID=A0A2T3ZEM3_TRIA4|nr:hypothetical protein M441DRAFT_368538 [Trichoderma asperellum CBS 433.97]PTB43244.1 hypothetical protein M441DRAFT_368538 [Trichoderma asperellum CBS 433.97]
MHSRWAAVEPPCLLSIPGRVQSAALLCRLAPLHPSLSPACLQIMPFTCRAGRGTYPKQANQGQGCDRIRGEPITTYHRAPVCGLRPAGAVDELKSQLPSRAAIS